MNEYQDGLLVRPKSANLQGLIKAVKGQFYFFLHQKEHLEIYKHHHHGKEEKILFPVMTAHLGKMAENLVTHGMLVEHDLGRSHIRALETSLKLYQENQKTEHKLSIITEAMGYSNLLLLHTEKENSVVYTFAERMLSLELKDKIDVDCKAFEEEQSKLGIQEKYLKMLNDFISAY